MGQAGSVEQKNAVRDVVSIKIGQQAEKEATLQALQTFCKMFPVEVSCVCVCVWRFCMCVACGRLQLADVYDMLTYVRSYGQQPVVAEEAFDVKDRKLFDVVHALLQEQTERTEKNTNEELVREALYCLTTCIRRSSHLT